MISHKKEKKKFSFDILKLGHPYFTAEDGTSQDDNQT